jgi:TPR repeat protein
LSQGGSAEESSEREPSVALPNGIPSEASLEALRKAAEAGAPSAQLSLSQAYAQRALPEDLVRAYMWYVVAKQRAAEAGELITKQMTAQQIEAAEQQASTWISRLKKVPPQG